MHRASIAMMLPLALAACDGERQGARAAPVPVAAPSATEDIPSSIARNAYGHAVKNLPGERWGDVRQGKAVFVATWVVAGAAEAERKVRGPSSQVREGLGPLFNATSCQSCHFKDGRGGPPPDLRRPAEAHSADYLAPQGLPRLLRLGRLGDEGQLLPDPRYGLQLQDRALPGHTPEGSFVVETRPVSGRYADGAPFTLEAPVVSLRGLRDGPLHPATRLSLRLPQSLIGLGLLEEVPEAQLVALADPDDADGDGISGRVSRVREATSGQLAVGRFGWKASQPSLRQQNATALREDLGVSTALFPDLPCGGAAVDGDGAVGSSAVDCVAAPLGALHELPDAELELLTRYTRLLEPPVRRDRELPEVVRGAALFTAHGCVRCHQPSLTTGDVVDLPELSRRAFEAYTDLLLHDLGEGLAEERPEGGASGREWRTAPLWGLGLLGAVTGEVRLLHDGRARTVEEAILWHGGEAQAARDAFTRAPAAERVALLRFLESL